MSKRLLPVLLLLATAALAGCGDDDSGDDSANGHLGRIADEHLDRRRTPQGSADPADVSCDYPADGQIPAAKEVDPPPSQRRPSEARSRPR